MVDERRVSSGGGVDPGDLRRAAKADSWRTRDAVLAAVAGLAHHQLALEELDPARTVESGGDQRRSAGGGPGGG